MSLSVQEAEPAQYSVVIRHGPAMPPPMLCQALPPGGTVGYDAVFKVPAKPGLLRLQAGVYHGPEREKQAEVLFRVVPAAQE